MLSAYGTSLETITNSTTELLDFHHNSESKIVPKLGAIDSKLRSLQEKSQIWEILLHHMDALGDYISTVDRKIDSLIQNRDHLNSIENRLINFEHLLRHYIVDAGDKQLAYDDATKNDKNVHKQRDSYSSDGDNIEKNVKGIKRAADYRPGQFNWHKTATTSDRPPNRPAKGQIVSDNFIRITNKLEGETVAKSSPARLELDENSEEKNEVRFPIALICTKILV